MRYPRTNNERSSAYCCCCRGVDKGKHGSSASSSDYGARVGTCKGQIRTGRSRMQKPSMQFFSYQKNHLILEFWNIANFNLISKQLISYFKPLLTFRILHTNSARRLLSSTLPGIKELGRPGSLRRCHQSKKLLSRRRSSKGRTLPLQIWPKMLRANLRLG